MYEDLSYCFVTKVSYLIVDGMYEELPEMMKDQYWDNQEFKLPYTEASQPFQKEEHVGSASKIELVTVEKFVLAIRGFGLNLVIFVLQELSIHLFAYLVQLSLDWQSKFDIFRLHIGN